MRLLVNDDARQGEQARRLFESDEIWIGVTVLLEAAWVLESAYELSTQETAKALRGLLGLPNVRVEDSVAVAAAFDAASLVDWPRYSMFGFKSAAGLQFSRGCTLTCVYCGQWMFWKKWRHRSPENVVEQLKILAG